MTKQKNILITILVIIIIVGIYTSSGRGAYVSDNGKCDLGEERASYRTELNGNTIDSELSECKSLGYNCGDVIKGSAYTTVSGCTKGATTTESTASVQPPIKGFKILNVRGIPLTVNQGKAITVKTTIRNEDTWPVEMRVECGIYQVSEIDAWYRNAPAFATYPIIESIPNCVKAEDIVSAFRITLDGSQTLERDFSFKAPYGNPVDEYEIHCQAHRWCWQENHNGRHETEQLSFYRSSAFGDTIVLKGTQYKVSCDNQVADGDEEGVDCGGSCPRKCDEGEFAYKPESSFISKITDPFKDLNKFIKDPENRTTLWIVGGVIALTLILFLFRK